MQRDTLPLKVSAVESGLDFWDAAHSNDAARGELDSVDTLPSAARGL